MMPKRILAALALLAFASAGRAQTYRVVPEESQIQIHVGTAGLFSMFGHDHHIRADGVAGTVEWGGERPETMQVTLEIEAGSLSVDDEGLSEEDRTEVQSTMESEALALPDHPVITFTSSRVEAERDEAGSYRATFTGELDLRGVRRELEVPATLEVASDRITARGELELDSSEWGVPRISVAGGTVKTDEELDIEFTIVAARE